VRPANGHSVVEGLEDRERLIGPLPSICFDTLGVRQNYVSPSMAKPANGSSWVTPMPIGGARERYGRLSIWNSRR
jgi:hypothetical protein